DSLRSAAVLRTAGTPLLPQNLTVESDTLFARPSSFQLNVTVSLRPVAPPKFGVAGPIARMVTVATPLSSLRAISACQGTIGLPIVVLLTVRVVSVAAAPRLAHRAVNDCFSNDSMMSCASAV